MSAAQQSPFSGIEPVRYHGPDAQPALGFGYYDISFVLALANFLVLVALGKLKPDNEDKPAGNEA